MKFSITLTVFLLFAVVFGAYLYLMPSGPDLPSSVSAPHSPRKLLELGENDEVRGVQVIDRLKNQTLTLNLENGTWYMDAPVRYAADPLIMEGILSALRLTPMEKEMAPDKGWDDFGLKDPDLKVGIKTREHPSYRFLYLGNKSPVGDRIYGRWEKSGLYFLADERIKAVFMNSIYTFRDKKVFRTPLKHITKMRFQNGAEVFEIIKGPSGWLWMEPIQLLGSDVSEESGGGILALLQNTYIKDFFDEPPDFSMLGFDAIGDNLQIKVWTDISEIPEALTIGHEVPEKDAFYAKMGDDETVFLIAQGSIVRLFELLANEALQHPVKNTESLETLPQPSAV